MVFTEKERKTLKNIDQKLRWSRKKIEPMLEEDSYLNKSKKAETADSEEFMEVEKS